MADRVHVLTPEGKQQLEEELAHLTEVRRPQVAARLKAAIEDGDLTENAGYDEAKREQGFVEGRIRELQSILANAQILGDDADTDRVSVGCRVTVVEGEGAPETYHIVGVVEADPSRGRISYESPLGRALLGRSVGDRVEVQTPGGLLRFRITDIQ